MTKQNDSMLSVTDVHKSIVLEDIGGEQIWTIENIDLNQPPPNGTFNRFINSPRSLEAFRRAGIEPKELDPVNKKALASMLKARENGKSPPNEILNIRFEFADDKRRKKLEMLKETRQAIIDDQFAVMKSTISGGMLYGKGTPKMSR